MNTFPGGIFSAQFLLEHLCLQRLLPFAKDEVVLPCEVGRAGLTVYPPTPEVLWHSTEDKHCLSDPFSLSVGASGLHPDQDESTQINSELGYHPTFQWLKDYQQVRIQQTCKLSQEAQELAQKYKDCHLKLERNHEERWVEMAQEGNVIFQEISMTGPIGFNQIAALVHFLCHSLLLYKQSAGYCHVIGWRQLSPLHQGWRDHWLQVPLSSPSHPTGTLPPLLPLLLDFTLDGIPLVSYPFLGFTVGPSQRKQDHCPSSSLSDHCSKRTHVSSQEINGKSGHSSAQGNENIPMAVLELGLDLNHGSKNMLPPLPVWWGPLMNQTME